jgi:uncharacterized glyoxalase superfamily protein PhnB
MSEIQRIIPLLACQDIPGEHDFLVTVLGFQPGHVERDEQGQPLHGEVYAGELTIWLHRVMPESEAVPPGAWKSGLVVHVTDVGAHYARVQAAGATITSQPEDQPYGQREYGVRDPEGHQWWFATQLET